MWLNVYEKITQEYGRVCTVDQASALEAYASAWVIMCKELPVSENKAVGLQGGMNDSMYVCMYGHHI